MVDRIVAEPGRLKAARHRFAAINENRGFAELVKVRRVVSVGVGQSISHTETCDRTKAHSGIHPEPAAEIAKSRGTGKRGLGLCRRHQSPQPCPTKAAE